MMHPVSSDDHHFRREDRAALWRRIARHVEGHPEDLAIALENLDRWQELGRVHPGPIHEWRKRILAAQGSPEGMRALLDFMAEPNHDSEPIKSCSPFVGLPMVNPATWHSPRSSTFSVLPVPWLEIGDSFSLARHLCLRRFLNLASRTPC